MITTVIVEDDYNSRALLSGIIENHLTDVQLIAQAKNVAEAAHIINSQNPDLVFLDIELPDGNGFDVLDQCTSTDFAVIFITAYDQYSIRAIKYAAFDYLLKPIDLVDIQQSVSRLKNHRFKIVPDQLDILRQSAQRKNPTQIFIHDQKGYAVLDILKIMAIEAQLHHLLIYLENGEKHVVFQTLKHYEDLLPKDQFFRIHKSHMINVGFVEFIESGRTGSVRMKNKMLFAIAARRKAAFIKAFKHFHSVG